MARMVQKRELKFCIGSGFIISYYLLAWEKEWYMFPIILTSLALFNCYLQARERWIQTEQETEKFQGFLEDFQFLYQTHQTMENALEALAFQFPEVMEFSVYRKLAGERVSEEQIISNSHKRIFALLLEFYAEYGREESFLKGLSFLKECVEEEILLAKRRRQAFAGMLFVAAGSLFAIKPVEKWAVKNVEELLTYYSGEQGKFMKILCVSILFFILRILIWLCYEVNIEQKENPKLIEWLLEKEWVSRGINGIILVFKKHYEWLYQLLDYVNYKGDCQSFLLKQLIRMIVCFFAMQFLTLGNGYKLLVQFFAFFSPYLDLLACWYQLPFIREQEILYLQSVLIAGKDIQEISAETLNRWLIRASDYYKNCFLSLSGRIEFVKEEEILSQYAEHEDAFCHILEGLLKGCDFKWSFVFSGIEGEQRFYWKRNKLKRAKYFENEGSLGRIFMMIPSFLILLGWLILPFVLEGLKQLTFYAQSMKSI